MVAVLVVVTLLLPSRRWVFGLIFAAGAVLLGARMSYGLFPNPVLARAWFGLLLNSAIIAFVVYAVGLLWFLARRN